MIDEQHKNGDAHNHPNPNPRNNNFIAQSTTATTIGNPSSSAETQEGGDLERRHNQQRIHEQEKLKELLYFSQRKALR